MLLLCLAAETCLGAENRWPQFRGPGGSGVASSEQLPERWSRTENVVWSVEIPGRGWSSPILWGERIFLTTAVSAGEYKQPSPGIYGNDYAAELYQQGLTDEEVMAKVVARDIELASETEEVRYMVYALDVASGEIVWQREAHRGKPFGGRHRKNTYASETPATDGERIYAYFGNVGLFCYSMEGEPLWKHSFEPQPVYLNFGTASSPIVHGEHVYVQSDNESESYLAAIDRKKGQEVWRTSRKFGERRILSGWSTPFVWDNSMRTEIVAVGLGHAAGYDTNGRELWRLSGLNGQATPTPVAVSDVLYVGTGSQGESNRPMFALRPGALEDVSLKDGEKSNDFILWTHPRASAYTPSPLVSSGRMYVVNDNGILSVFDAKTGERVHRARLGGGGYTFSSSPWAYDEKIFFLSEGGDTFVVRADDSHDEIAANRLDEMSLATPAIGEDSLFIRTQSRLYRISETQQ